MNLASITAGAYHGSELLAVSCADPDGTLIVVYRGLFLLGQATLTAGQAMVAVPKLANGDVIQASVAQRGNQAGVPAAVTKSARRASGWVNPQTVQVRDASGGLTNLTAAQYEAQYGEKPAASYDPQQVLSVVAPDPVVLTVAASALILFDLRVEQSAGLTTVTIQNVVNQSGLPLVRWATSESFGNALSRGFTANATVTIDVKGEGDATYVTRTISISVFNPPSGSPGSSDIKALSYRLMGSSDFVRVCVNSLKACECRLEGFDMNWQSCIFYGFGPDYQEGTFTPVPGGTYTIWVRVAGDADSSHWKSLTITTA